MYKLLPEIIFVSINSIFFVKTAISIYKTQSEIQKVLKNKTAMQVKCYRYFNFHYYITSIIDAGCYSFLVFMKLFSLMGVTRIVEIIFWFIFHRQRNMFVVVLQALGSLQALWLIIFCMVSKEKVRGVFMTWLKNVFFCCKCESTAAENALQAEQSVSFKSNSSNFAA